MVKQVEQKFLIFPLLINKLNKFRFMCTPLYCLQQIIIYFMKTVIFHIENNTYFVLQQSSRLLATNKTRCIDLQKNLIQAKKRVSTAVHRNIA